MSNITTKLKHLHAWRGGAIGLDTYPIFDEAYRSTLNQNIIDTYWNREIAYESGDMFTLALRARMNLRMPYYNKLYTSELKDFDPLVTIDMLTEGDAESESTSKDASESKNESDSTSQGRTVSSDTPQTMLSGRGDYATSASDANSFALGEVKATSSGDSATEGKQKSKSRTKGFQGIPADLIMAYRASLLNVDQMIVEELEDFFLMVFDTSDAYFNNLNPSTYYLGY